MANNRGGRGRRLADKTLKPEPERDPVLHAPEDCPDCHEPHDDPVILTPTDRVINRMQMHTGRLVDFHMARQRLVEGTWLDVVSFDCRHDTVHMHRYDEQGQRSSRTVLKPISTQRDVEDGHIMVSSLLYDEWVEELGGDTHEQ